MIQSGTYTGAGAPELALPEAEAEALRVAYEEATTILEYGSGGSTVMAGAMAGKTVFSVESDPEWTGRLRSWFSTHPPEAQVHLHPVDVGPVKEWGMPKGHSHWRQYPAYPLSVWDREDFRHPDVVFIDGRFRAGCLLAALFRITRPVLALFDDYAGRSAYHAVEGFVRPVRMIGRMAEFHLSPTQVPAERLLGIIDLMTRPR